MRSYRCVIRCEVHPLSEKRDMPQRCIVSRGTHRASMREKDQRQGSIFELQAYIIPSPSSSSSSSSSSHPLSPHTHTHTHTHTPGPGRCCLHLLHLPLPLSRPPRPAPRSCLGARPELPQRAHTCRRLFLAQPPCTAEAPGT